MYDIHIKQKQAVVVALGQIYKIPFENIKKFLVAFGNEPKPPAFTYILIKFGMPF